MYIFIGILNILCGILVCFVIGPFDNKVLNICISLTLVNVIGINGLADLSFSPTAYHGVVASVISPGNFNGVGQVIYDTVAFPNILGELYVIDYELI